MGFETDMDGSQSAGAYDKNEIAIDNEDETDQAKVCYPLWPFLSSFRFC